MKVSEVLKICEENGHKVTKQGLYFSGKKYGFLLKKDSGYILNEEKLKEWLRKSTEEIPPNFITMKQASIKFGKSVSSIWLYIKYGNLETKRFGAGEGVIYVNENQLGEFIQSNR